MLDRISFELLRDLAEIGRITPAQKRSRADSIKSLISDGLIDQNYGITQKGLDALEPHRVKNAIVLAAGMSTRFIPVSYELPKGLISVKGDVMVERIIRQLQSAGVEDVTVVVGYMMEKFLYLREKFGVRLVVNSEFATKNTHSSIYVARDHIDNAYICCSDNYYPKNPFHKYEYAAFYCSVYLPGTSYVERAFHFDENGLIYDTNKPSKNQWIMFGHAYFDTSFTKEFKPILESYYGRPGVEGMYWENVYAENVKRLPMYIKKCTHHDILEFDSMDELKVFDPDFIRHNKIKIFENICSVLGCNIEDVTDVVPIKKGINNRSFKFTANNKSYVYRHPGVTAKGVIDRKKEATSLKIAKELGIDNTLIYVDENEGFKISSYVETTGEFDFDNGEHVKLLARHLKALHQNAPAVGYSFDYQAEADKLIDYLRPIDNTAYLNLLTAREKMAPVFQELNSRPWKKTLCHNDIYEPNLLLHRDGLELIDWEFAGDSDVGFDVCKLFTLSKLQPEQIDEYLSYYFERPATDEEKAHLYSCASVIYYYWFVWAIYESKTGGKASSYMMFWHDRMEYFLRLAIDSVKGAN